MLSVTKIQKRNFCFRREDIVKNLEPGNGQIFWDALMQILASQIAKELEKANHCAVYEPDLTRVWPRNGRTREAKVALFAQQNGWRLRFYKDGFCAIFDKEPSR